ncbi:glycosyltransferase family 2 protein [Ferruginibacter yonginensis]|uniref:Glycosyltransferase family 2 protein n=1 Tax=Ferruginibacter yonginensis TaxID=1310416 RepID=A0ABV8QPY2_9BACT
MYLNKNIKLVIPAYNEAESIALVINAVPKNICTEIIVTDNNSKDDTAAIANACGATVLFEKNAGYGNACLKGLDYIRQQGGCDVVVFLDADFSDYPDEMQKIITPIIEGKADMVIGSRIKKLREPGSMTPQQVFGNWLAVTLIKIFFKHQFTDLGPFRAITWEALEKIKMVDKNYGWTVEMQVKAVKHQLRCVNVPVKYRHRAGGVSKVSGSIKGSIMAGYKIIKTIFKYA